MTPARQISYLIKGLPSNIKKDVYLRIPQTVEEFKNILLQYEKYDTSFNDSSLAVATPLSELESKIKALELTQASVSASRGQFNDTFFLN